jgi:hypothetical protein
MDLEKELQKQSNEAIDSKQAWLTPLDAAIVKELLLCGQNSKTEIPPELQGEFLRVFEGTEPPCIVWAFRQWRLISAYMPAIANIAELVERRYRIEHEEAEQKKTLKERAKVGAARARGELADFTDILKQLNDQVGRMPEAPHIRRMREARSQELRINSPALQLTAEQIAARRPRELEEIERRRKQDENAGYTYWQGEEETG